ncbi:insulinase family protein [Panacibacter ginsenosidivorans]|uniref:Insulinase family protein n=1 Tax=Panacibacter ginsenosidivorans TaxID=1813871 RepID=A0A5B8VB19_9BACT|nr:pitrilysin family protein [Panacibacter ginsenosidivorans]QEC68677.1 insulinase family protein [Panacibacter ginsenosidivorans]
MKKIFIAATGLLFVTATMAQSALDRSQRPKPGPAPVISFKDPVMYKLPNGITVLVVENHKLPKVSATYSIDAGPITEGSKAGTLDIMGQMLGEGTTKMTKAQFDEAVDQMGADVSLSAGGGSVGALTRYFDKAFTLMTEALKSPAFTQESFDKIKSQTLTDLKSNEKSAKAISANVVSALAYGLDHPNGEFTTEATVNNITLDDVKKAYAAYITPSRGYLTFVGDITPAQAKALAEKTLATWKGVALTLPQLKTVANPDKTEIDLVDVPNAVQSEITVTNLVSLPMSSPDYFPVLLTNQILGGGGDARLFMNLREHHGFTYGSYSRVNAGRFQTTFGATASVRNDKVDSAVAEILHEIDTIRTKKVSADELANAKAIYNGSFALGLENPARTAGFASNILINNLPKDFYRTYLQKINAVTVDDVQRVAQKYFNYSNTRIVVVGKAATVQAGLAKLGYEVKMYDKNAKPVATKSTAAVNMTADQVVQKFITVSGGADELKKINSMVMTASMTIQGMQLDAVSKKLAPNMELTEISMNGQVAMKEVFDGTTGYQAQMGNKSDMGADEIAQKKDVKGIFPQLFYNDGSYKLEVAGIEKVGDADAYKVKITTAAGNESTEYYDAATGYLVKQESVVKQGGMEIQQSTELSNYKKVGTVMLPFTYNVSVQTPQGNQDFTMEAKEYKLNEAIAADEFK